MTLLWSLASGHGALFLVRETTAELLLYLYIYIIYMYIYICIYTYMYGKSESWNDQNDDDQ